ncbi:MAG: chemotaxis protein [Desulfobulbaceae bacterium]|nr:chemotaxis protein [Desulfobulbaceae bacterium]HIJ77836.1 chemotaxis protein CheV [Deltaproteobacteria bacterium]
MSQTQSRQSEILLKSGTNELEIITFYLQWFDPTKKEVCKTSYGINAAKVRELVAMPEKLTELPDSPSAAMKGVFLLRDRTIPLIDLCEWFEYEADLSPEARAKWVVIVSEINGKFFGFVAHGVDKVYRVSWKEILPPPDIVSHYSSLTGVCLVDNNIIQMVDFEKIIASIDPSMVIDSAAHAITVRPDADQVHKAVVIAEDSKLIQEQIIKTLDRAGYRVVAHSDGLDAWNYLEALREQGTIDTEVLAVITDIEMPRMDGHHLCLRIKEDSAFNKIPVMLFSSLINDAARHKGESVGADDQITKPELGQLVSRLQACLHKRQG